MKSHVLSISDIKKLAVIQKKVMYFFTSTKNTYPLAKHIKYPQIPDPLSESLVYHLVQKGILLPQFQTYKLIRHGGNKPDITAEKSGEVLSIEVKATGIKGFQQFGRKDIGADYLVWIAFDTFFTVPEEISFTIYSVYKPSRYFKVGKIKLTKFKEAAKDKEELQLRLSDLKD